MSEDIRSLTADLAADPTSLVFLRLGEALRSGRRLEAASKVALQGLGKYPDLPEAHDLFARILADQGDFERAFDEWDITIRLEPAHGGAHKGIGFLYFRAGEHERALEHLSFAAQQLPDDPAVRAGLARVREYVAPAARPVPSKARIPATGTGGEGQLLVDHAGRKLDGCIRAPAGEDVSDKVAAELTGVSREAERASRLLDLGEWESLTVETRSANYVLLPPTADTMLLMTRGSEVPMGRLAMLAERAADVARDWLEGAE